jgi:hypothetical protein
LVLQGLLGANRGFNDVLEYAKRNLPAFLLRGLSALLDCAFQEVGL